MEVMCQENPSIGGRGCWGKDVAVGATAGRIVLSDGHHIAGVLQSYN